MPEIMVLVLQSIGLLIVAVVVLRVILLLVSSWRQLVHKQRQHRLAIELGSHRVEASKSRLEREQIRLWDGYRKFVLSKKASEAKDICSFYLAPNDGKSLPPFKPGQYLTFKLNLPGLSKPLIRCYSLSDSPNHTAYYRVSVKKLLPPPDRRDLSPGKVSTFFHDHLQEGDILDVKAPSGKFFLDVTRGVPVVLIGGGVGLTPVLSMLNSLTANGSPGEVWFFYGVRNGVEHMMKDHLTQLNLEFDSLHLHVCYSAPGEEDVLGRDYHHKGHVDLNLFKSLLPSNNYEFYICGPPEMMGAITHDLKSWGVPDNKVFFESFGPATVKKAVPEAAAVSSTGVMVTFGKGDKTCPWDPNSGSLLEFAEANGVNIDSGCRAGNCGTCLTAVKSGEVTYLSPPGSTPESGSCLPCISVPKTSLSLDA